MRYARGACRSGLGAGRVVPQLVGPRGRVRGARAKRFLLGCLAPKAPLEIRGAAGKHEVALEAWIGYEHGWSGG